MSAAFFFGVPLLNVNLGLWLVLGIGLITVYSRDTWRHLRRFTSSTFYILIVKIADLPLTPTLCDRSSRHVRMVDTSFSNKTMSINQ